MKNIFIQNICSVKNLACAALLATASFGVQAIVCGDQPHGYIVKNSTVYYWWDDLSSEDVKTIERVLPEIDVNTFQKIGEPISPPPPTHTPFGDCPTPATFYGKDLAHVYYKGEIIEGADPATFSMFDRIYTKDKSHIFFETKPISSLVETFHRIDSDGNLSYATDGENYYINDVAIKGKEIEILYPSYGYARIDNNIFYRGKLVSGADAKTFVLSYPSSKITKDKNHVFYNGNYIAGADPETFELIARTHDVFKDRHSVYLKGVKVPGFDPFTVKASEFGDYLLDDHFVYTIVYEAYVKNKDNSAEIKLLKNRDATSFHELQPFWTLDKNGVYYEDRKVAEADQFSFHAINSLESEDQNFGYSNGRIYCKFLNDSPGSFPNCEKPFGNLETRAGD